jgi:hypothetical protein
MVVEPLDAAAVDDLRQTPRWAGMALEELMNVLFPELLKLNPDGRVHAKTVYSALNLVRRSPPGPIFAALLDSQQYQAVGDGFWAMK